MSNGRKPPTAPLWRIVFDAVERESAPRLEALTRREEFARLIAYTTRFEATMRRNGARRLQRFWHFWNLPAYTDIRTYAERLAAVERQLRDLAERLPERE